MLDRWFLAHPKSVGETYFAHQRMAFGFSAALFKAAAACFVHGLVPGLFQTTGSRTVMKLHERMVTNRRRDVTSAAPDPRSAAASRRAGP